MKEALKIRIANYSEVEETLFNLGAEFIQELNVMDTYFKQLQGSVLKITEDERGKFLVKLKEEKGKFRIRSYDAIDDLEGSRKQLEEKHGIKCVLIKEKKVAEV